MLVGGSWKVGEGSFGFCLVESELNQLIFPVQLSPVGPRELGLLTPPRLRPTIYLNITFLRLIKKPIAQIVFVSFFFHKSAQIVLSFRNIFRVFFFGKKYKIVHKLYIYLIDDI